MDTMAKDIRFTTNDVLVTQKLRITLKEHGYVWGSGNDLETYLPYEDEALVDLIINPYTKQVLYINKKIHIFDKEYHIISVVDYNPPW